MKELESKFNELFNSCFTEIKDKYKNRKKYDNVFDQQINNAETYSKLLDESSNEIVNIANSIFDMSQKTEAEEICRKKMNDILPEIKELSGF